MARNYGNKHLSKRDFLTSGATPEAQNAQANAKDNAQELASQALGSVNKQLYDFIANAVQTNLSNIVQSGTVEFEKLSQQVYSNIVDIVEGKMKDGDIADAMIENLDIYNGEVKPAEGETTTQTTETQVPEKPEVVEKTESVEGKTTEVEGETTEVETPPITVETPPVEVESVHEAVTLEQTRIQPTREVVTQEQPKVERQIEERTIVERPEDEHPELPAGFFVDEKEMEQLRTKLKLLFVYLRSQKLDIFKILAGVDEGLIGIREKRDEINLDYEEELRRRQNQRKEFNRQVALESAWYEQAFGALEQEEEERPVQPPKKEEPEEAKPVEKPAVQEKPAEKPVERPQKEPMPVQEPPKGEPPAEKEAEPTVEREKVVERRPAEEGESEKKEGPQKEEKPIEPAERKPDEGEPSEKKEEKEESGEKKEGDEESAAKDAEKEIVEIDGDSAKDEKGRGKKDDKKKKKKPNLISRVIGRILSPLKGSKEGDFKKKFVFVVVPLGDEVNVKQKKGMDRLLKKNPLEQKEEKKKDEGEMPKKAPLRQRIKSALQTAKTSIRNAPKNLFKKAKEAIKKKIALFKFKRDRKTKYFKYVTLFRVKNKKELKLWGREFKWKRGTKKIAKDLGIQGDIPPEHKYGKDEKDSKDKKSILDEDEDSLTLKQLTPPKLKKPKLFDKLFGGLFKGRHPAPDENLPKDQQEQKNPTPVKRMVGIAKKFVRRRVVKTRAAVRRTWRKVSGRVKKVWNRAKKRVRIVARKLGRKVKSVARRAWRGMKRFGKRLGLKARKLGRRAWKGMKRFGKKVWSGAKRFGRNAWAGMKKVGRKVWGGAKRVGKAALRVAAKVGKAVWNVGKKVAAAAYKTTAKVAVAVTKGLGKGLKSAGKAAAKIPYAGVVLGPILMGLGVGISAAARALKVAFKAAGKAAKAAAKVAEKAFASFMKAVTKGSKGAKGAIGRLSGIGGAFKKFSFRGLFTQLGRAIKGWTSKFIINGFAKKAMSGIKSLGKKGLKLKEPALKLKAKWGSSKIRKESVEFLKGIHRKGIHAVKGTLRTSFAWITSLMNMMGDGMTKMLSTLGERISTIGSVGLKGFLKALFSPAFLVPLGLTLLFFFREQVFGWLKGLGEITFKGIFSAIKGIGKAVGTGLKFVWGILSGVGKWIWNQSDPKRRWSVGWFMTHGVGLAIKFIRSIKKYFLSLVPGGNGSAFMLGMALGGYPWPLYGAMIYGAVKAGVLNVWKFIKQYIRTELGILLCWLPEWPVDLFGKVMRLLGLGDVDPFWKKSAPTLDDALTKVEDNESKVNKLVVNLSAANHINPVLKEVGLPDLNRFNKSVTSRVKEANADMEKYGKFIQESSVALTDKNKAPGVAPTFYGSPAVAEALLSVFFFKDPLTGQILSLIPKSNIAGVVTGIQNLVLGAVEKNDPYALVDANTDILNYFDYMNRGRGNAIATITEKYTKFIDRLSNAEGDRQREIAEDFTKGMKNGDFTAEAIKNVQLDMMVKQGKASTNQTSQTQIEGSGDNVGRGSVRSKGAMSLVNASVSASSLTKKPKDGEGIRRLDDFVLTPDELGQSNKKKPPEPDVVSKRKSWEKYKEERNNLIRQGKSDSELKALGYGMDAREWSRNYDAQKEKELQKDGKAVKAKPPAEGGMPVVKLGEPKIPKIVLPVVKFKEPKKQIKISLPGLTRDVKQGTTEYKLYDMGVKQAEKEAQLKLKDKKAAWNKYKEERSNLIRQGKSDAELAALGYGLNAKEWSRKYDAEQAEKERQEAEKQAAEAGDNVPADEQEKDKQEKSMDKELPSADKPFRITEIPGDFTGLIDKMNKLHTDLKFAFDGLTTASVLPNLGIVKGNGKVVPIGERKKERKKKSIRAWLSSLKDKAKNIKDIIGLKKDNDKDILNKTKSIAEMMAEPPKEKDLTVNDSPKEQEAVYKKAGVSLVSDAQWVSAQEAHKMEEKIIQNAKSVRDIIEGLMIMGDNLDNAKIDLHESLEKIRKNPIGEVINLPPRTMPAPLQLSIPGDEPDYDPLPPL